MTHALVALVVVAALAAAVLVLPRAVADPVQRVQRQAS
jgi:hypothetical protein